MGKQVMFYMAKSDEDGSLTTCDHREMSPSFRRLHGKSCERSFEISVKRRDDRWEKAPICGIGRSHQGRWSSIIPQQGYYWLDFLQSEVVNVMRSKMTDQGLSMGRLHVEDKIRGTQGNMRQKNERFEAWVSDLFRWIKQQSVRVIDGAYVLPEANALIWGYTGNRPQVLIDTARPERNC